MSHASLRTATVLLCVLLAACGGGGDGGSATTNTGGTPSNNNSGAAGGGGNDNPAPAPSPAPFTAAATTAPAEGSVLSGIVRLEVRGTGLENVELLPPDGYTPVLGRFTVSADKTLAWLDFDTRILPNGVLLTRISAFNQPPGGSGASEVVAMTTRSWELNNTPMPTSEQVPSASYMPEVRLTYEQLPYVDPQPLVAMTQMDDMSFAHMVANEWPRVEGELHRYVPANVVLYPPTPLGFHAAWSSCGPQSPAACREVMVYLVALMRGKEG